MKPTPRAPVKNPSHRSSLNLKGWQIALFFALFLSLLFWRSFLSEYVLFSNDGPLGQNMPAWIQPIPGLMGMWGDLNTIGNSVGSWTLDGTMIVHVLLGVLGSSKFYVPLAIFILGMCAWAFFRSLKLAPLAAGMGSAAVMLNSAYFAGACWGVGSQEIGIGMSFLAIAFYLNNECEKSAFLRGIRLCLAGFCVGMTVMEAGDIGALLSMLVAAFVLFKSFMDSGEAFPIKLSKAIGRVAVIAFFAGFIAFQTVTSLVSTQIQGVAGTAQDSETKAQRWDWATQWSLPKKETLGIFVPGLFGYKMDTPKDMMPVLQSAYEGGVYWGGMGRDPALDRWFDNGSQGNPPSGFMRFSGGGNYCGILVGLIAFWAVAQSLRKQNSPFTAEQKKFIWFWAVVLVLSLLLAWGRFAPMFYGLLYKLPYFSTIRNPAKFIIFFTWAILVLFGYGLHALSSQLNEAAQKPAGMAKQLKGWWASATLFDRRWTAACIVLLAISVLGWLVFLSQKPAFIHYLQQHGFPDENMAGNIATFSINQVFWFIILLAIAIALVTFIIAGYFRGDRAKMGVILMGVFLLFDLGRADAPYIIHWDYKQKYEVGALNPIVEFLTKKPYEHRVAALPFRTPEGFELFDQLYRIEWMQHHFPYYNIQCLDIIQMPRIPQDLKAYLGALSPNGTAESVPLIARRWELSNTRYLLGPAGFLDVMNEQLDPVQKRFCILQRFEVVPKPGILQPTQLEQMTAMPNENGRYALFEFAGALPRASLYGNWQVNTNDTENLKTLADLTFDPAKTVLVSTPQKNLPGTGTNASTGTVEYQSYAPKHIVLSVDAKTAGVLLLNDKYDPNWRVTVDGKPAELLRCNFLMRGVYLQPGQHEVEFKFSLPSKPLYVTLAAAGLGIVLCGLLLYFKRHEKTQPPA